MQSASNLPAPYRGPHTGSLAIVSVVLFAASIIISMAATGGTPIPTLNTSITEVHDYYIHSANVISFTTMLQFASAIPLGIFTAAITHKLRLYGANVAGVNIAAFGGYAASIFIAISAIVGWVATYPGLANDVSLLRGFQLFQFISGGIAHVVVLGLLLAGVSIPGLLMKLIPRWLAWLGLITVVCAELTTLSMYFPQLFILIPLGRFPAFIWMIGVGFTMRKKKDA